MKIFPLLALISFFISCSSCDKNDDGSNTTTPPVDPPVGEIFTEAQLMDKVQKEIGRAHV